MPTDHAEVELKDVRVPADAVLGEVDRGLEVGQTFVHENRIRQAACSLGAAQYCIDRAVAYANERTVFGKPLAVNQAIQLPLVELQTEAEMVRLLVYYAATQLDRNHHMEVSDKVSMANYRANRLVCEAADRAMQVCGGVGYSRHKPFEHIYRHHRRYRITEGAEEIQIRRVAQRLVRIRAQVKEQLRCGAPAPVLGEVSIENLHALTGGASRTTWAFDAVGDGTRRQALILRTGPPDDVHAGMELEAERPAARGRRGSTRPAHPRSGQFACRTGQSVPDLRRDRRRDDRQADPSRPRRARPRAAAAAVRAGAGRHPPRRPGRDRPDDSPTSSTEWRDRLDEMGDTTATFEWAFRWLDAHRPAAVAATAGARRFPDGQPDRRRVRPGRRAGLGTRAHRRGRTRTWPGSASGPGGSARPSISARAAWAVSRASCRAYEAAAGAPVDRETFRWWLTLATLRWGVICRFQAERHLSGQTPSVELAAIGRRVSETEWDVLDLLEGGGPK